MCVGLSLDSPPTRKSSRFVRSCDAKLRVPAGQHCSQRWAAETWLMHRRAVPGVARAIALPLCRRTLVLANRCFPWLPVAFRGSPWLPAAPRCFPLLFVRVPIANQYTSLVRLTSPRLDPVWFASACRALPPFPVAFSGF